MRATRCIEWYRTVVGSGFSYLTKNLLCVPIVSSDGRCIGCTQLLNKNGASFSAMDEQLVAAHCTEAAVLLAAYRAQPAPLGEAEPQRDWPTTRAAIGEALRHVCTLVHAERVRFFMLSESDRDAMALVYPQLDIPFSWKRDVGLVGHAWALEADLNVADVHKFKMYADGAAWCAALQHDALRWCRYDGTLDVLTGCHSRHALVSLVKVGSRGKAMRVLGAIELANKMAPPQEAGQPRSVRTRFGEFEEVIVDIVAAHICELLLSTSEVSPVGAMLRLHHNKTVAELRAFGASERSHVDTDLRSSAKLRSSTSKLSAISAISGEVLAPAVGADDELVLTSSELGTLLRPSAAAVPLC